MDEAAPKAAGRRPVFWCKTCKEPVVLTGRSVIPQFNMAVHAATGAELGADGHLAMPTDEDPVLREQADAIERDFPQFKVSVRFGLFRATWRKSLLPPLAVPVPYSAPDERGLRERLTAVVKLSGAVMTA
jgi:hypothetical protein